MKRTFDLTIGLAGIVFVLPVMLAVAAAISVGTPGPVFYSQERVGRRRRPFRLFKFRTMRVGAEQATGPVWSWDGDPRVTALGRFLRATHLDELPQLWNVLRGEMSLVGPRPERAHFVEQLESAIPGYGERFDVLPGITGLSQLRGCLSLDTRILIETAWQATALSRLQRAPHSSTVASHHRQSVVVQDRILFE